MEELTEVQKLLRLKRYEQPSPGYYEDFLKEFQKRQRSEMLKVSPLGLLRDRVEAYFSGLPMFRPAYAGSFAMVAALGLLVAISIPGIRTSERSGATAQAGTSSSVSMVNNVGQAAVGGNQGSAGSLLVAEFPEDSSTQFKRGIQHSSPSIQPRYVLDSRPVSYEPPRSF